MRNYLSAASRIALLSTVFQTSLTHGAEIVQQPAILDHTTAIKPRYVLAGGFLKVPEGSVALVEYMGEYVGTALPGLHYHAPLLYQYIRVDTRTILVDTPQQIALTRDMQKLVIDGSFGYRITDPKKAVYNVQNLENNLISLFFESVLTHIGQLENNAAISLDKNKFSQDIKDTLNRGICGSDNQMIFPKNSSNPQSTGKYMSIELDDLQQESQDRKRGEDRDWGVEVMKVAITNIAYPESIVRSMNMQREAEYQRNVIETNATASKQKVAIEAEANLINVTKTAEAQAKRLEIETKVKLETARADAEARIIKAESEARAIELEAKAKANAKIMMGDVYKNHPELLQREQMQDVVTAMKDFYTSPNSKIIISDGGDKGGNTLVTQLLTMQAMFNTNGGMNANPLLANSMMDNHK